jgi:4-diphosphocytidyl-2C-methyl-D-erythritol kinase
MDNSDIRKQSYAAFTAGKINLSLNITGRRGRLHTLDMIMCPVNLVDKAVFTPDDSGELEIECVSNLAGFEGEILANGIKRAIDKYRQYLISACDGEKESGFAFSGKLFVEKNIPFAAGLGGSTASVISAVKVLNRHYNSNNVPLDDRFLLMLGSDAPYMFRGGFARVTATGERVRSVEGEDLYFAALVANGGVDSREAYALYDKLRASALFKTTASALRTAERDKEEELYFKEAKTVRRKTVKDVPQTEQTAAPPENASLTSEGNEFEAAKSGGLTENAAAEYGDTAGIASKNSDDEDASGKMSVCKSVQDALKRGSNDLYEAAAALNPLIEKAGEALMAAGAHRIILSGSGSTVAAVFKSKEEAARVLEQASFSEGSKYLLSALA